MDLERLDSRYMSLEVRYGIVFTTHSEVGVAAGEGEREELEFWQKNATPLLVKKLVGHERSSGIRHKIEAEM